MKNKWYGIAIGLIWLGTTGCMELIRRPEPPGANPESTTPPTRTETASATGNQDPETKVQQGQEALPPIPKSPAAATTRPTPQEASPIIAPLPHNPERADKKDIAQINEYALWCIQNGMWKEAKLHLQQALQQDSLMASVHNNLGIVYERFGQDEKAAAAYDRARQLKPNKKAYLTNIQYFDRRLKAHSDSSHVDRENMDLDLIEGGRDRSRSFVHEGD
ncbi:MAG: tetratricopeptide repeat protein [Candidatus Latescibacteria bacterium]|nr:tetratricopeptide repeat protein [Candidatus Latescibacterota bacterium]